MLLHNILLASPTAGMREHFVASAVSFNTRIFQGLKDLRWRSMSNEL